MKTQDELSDEEDSSKIDLHVMNVSFINFLKYYTVAVLCTSSTDFSYKNIYSATNICQLGKYI